MFGNTSLNKDTPPSLERFFIYPSHSPFAVGSPTPPEPQMCTCHQCTVTRLSQRMDIRLVPSPGAATSDEAANPPSDRPRARNHDKNNTKKPDVESQKRRQQGTDKAQPPTTSAQPLATSAYPRPDMAYPEVYVYPNTLSHITFPVVNYSKAYRAQQSSSRPVCSLAISPQCAKPEDFETALSPPGSGLIVVARLSKTKKTAPLSTFKDVEELRRESIQLEVWDEAAAKTRAKNETDAEADFGNVPDKAEAAASKKKGKGRGY